MYNNVLGTLAALLYLLSGSLIGLRLAYAQQQPCFAARPILFLLSIVAAILHALLLSRTILVPTGLNLGFFNALSFTGWLVALVLISSALLRPIESLGVILLPFSASTLLLGLIFPSQRIVVDSTHWPLEIHILLSILAYALLTLAAVQALLIAVQDRRLRSRHPGGFMRALPPLVTMEVLLFQMIGVGFVLLSLALLTGFLFLKDIFAQHLVHKTVLSTAAWTVFAVLLWGRWYYGWRGRMAIRWTLSGFLALMLSYFGSKLVLELLLQR